MSFKMNNYVMLNDKSNRNINNHIDIKWFESLSNEKDIGV